MAYDLTTGALLSWAPTLNAQGMTIEASSDGSRIFVGGDFTSVSGVARSRLVALDASTGAVITGFTANASSRVRALDVKDGTLYVGGSFTVLGGQARSRLAAVNTTTGALLPWAPKIGELEVFGLVAPAGSNPVVAGGSFTTANDQEVDGLAALKPAEAADAASLVVWPSYGIFPNHGPDSSIYSLSTDGTQIFGTAYDFGGPSEFEGSFGIQLSTGVINFTNACKGDTYSSFPIGDVLYTVGHPHDCGMVQGHPQTDPWTFQRAMAETKYAAVDGTSEHVR